MARTEPHAVVVVVAVVVANLAEWNQIVELLLAVAVIVVLIFGKTIGERRWPNFLADPRAQQLDRIEKAINDLTSELRGRRS